MTGKRSATRRWVVRLSICLPVIAVTAVLVTLLMNLSWFDEPLLPQIEALRKPRPVMLEGNGFAMALGFLAGEDRDPGAAGARIISALSDRRDRGEPRTLGKEEMRPILGSPRANEGLGDSLAFECQARHRLDCADRLIAWLDSVDMTQPRLALLFQRYEALLRQPHFIETPEPDLDTPWPPFGPIVALGRLRLAMSLHSDSTPIFLEKASQELTFWRMTLREGDRLGTKMVALAAIRNAHDFLSALLRARELDAHELESLRGFVSPFTPEERDIGNAFVSQVRSHLLSGVPLVSLESPWLSRMLMQENATFNLVFQQTIEPMRQRSSLDAREFHDLAAYEPLRHEMKFTPAVLFNLGGKLALSRSTWDPHQFPSRIHDEDGRIALILLQAEIEEHPESDVATVVRSSGHRNLYTGNAFDFDPLARTIGFTCLHTAFHPPELADQCNVHLGRGTP